jgi:RNA polymerase sigma factor (sigma-70 family)
MSTPPPRNTDFADAYDRHVFQVYGFFAYRVRTRDDAEDLTQLTFERALRAYGRFDPQRAQFLTWVLAIAHNILIDHYRSDRRAKQVPFEDLGSEEPVDESPGPDLGISGELRAALDELSARDREIVALRYGADLNGPEIAAVTGLELANVQQILSRSLRRMREAMEP